MQVTHTIPGEGPLFVQVQALIIQRMVDGIWPPGERLPSEFALAKELDVSQGTVRKALDALVHENLLIRHQGRGTFVSSHSDQRELFRFFHLVEKNDTAQSPQTSHLISHQRRKCSLKESKRLKIPKAAYVLNIRRVRSMGGTPVIIENIVVPDALITGLGQETEIPNELYQLYEQAYGVTIHKAVEHLRAGSTTYSEAAYLPLQEGDPLLEIDRLAAKLDGTPVEWRVSRCDTSAHSYLSELF
jgi:GntR family transcriptional regulator